MRWVARWGLVISGRFRGNASKSERERSDRLISALNLFRVKASIGRFALVMIRIGHFPFLISMTNRSFMRYAPPNISSSSCGGTTSSCANVQSFGRLSVLHLRNCAV